MTGPFFSFGQDSERKEMLKTRNGVQVKVLLGLSTREKRHHSYNAVLGQTAQEISEYNVKSLIHELYHKSMYIDAEPEKNEEKIVEVDKSGTKSRPSVHRHGLKLKNKIK